MKEVVLEAMHYGEFNIADAAVECAVLENGVRVFQVKGLFTAFDRTYHGRKVDGLPPVIGGKNLSEFITDEVKELCIPYRYKKSGSERVVNGYDAKLLPKVCMIYRDARRKGVLVKHQESVADRAELLLDALAETAITALIDEATGFELDRESGALAKILNNYIAKGLMSYEKRFPIEFYRELYRLYDWTQLDPNDYKRPQIIGKFTNEFIYGQFPTNVQAFMKEKSRVTSKDNKQYKIKYYRFLNKEVGLVELDSQIRLVLGIMRLSDSISDFSQKYYTAFPRENSKR
ncbi:P63C domain-containing protein [Bacillus albus]|uniref:P63C domain-containing protein n=1 Tax=Bacillus cereus group TaxID=86661 RepID=UPI0022E360E0|nr:MULTISPECIES: P63C domain-containing protein [Bacillus cereus group]MDA2261843.1 P63C domain-containing protein [Bacillus cereus group sp. Bc200]MDA2662445.1 P63C domain-containing protein [Bacillus cereus group sp. Bc032]MDA2673176.1 P63C domain-containing protein [Bacillus cereus group sp. Bc031]MDA2678604.1 P63C domain-containing protein [Bacillus cereus group sp. Bc029]MDA2684113.1 P63C domain-containing protein [Bacillus cereus group sp. Bc030]